MRVVVAGGTGFVGRHVVDAVSSRGHEVLVLARGTRPAAGVAPVACDVSLDPLPVERMRAFDALVNLVGIKREAGRQSFDFTVLKPAVIYGPGDDMLTHLVRMIRCAPFFPVVGHGDSLRRSDREWLSRRARGFSAALVLVTLAVTLQAVLSFRVPNVWYRMTTAAVALSWFALTRVDVGWRELLRPRLRDLPLGLGAALPLHLLWDQAVLFWLPYR